MVPTSDPRVTRLIDWYEHLTSASLRDIEAFYDPAATFKDPFNEVRGAAAIVRIFEHMFASLRAPRFRVVDAVCDAQACVLVWHFDFQRSSGAAMRIRGVSHLTFGADARVTDHRDYWDAAEELYEKLPLMGPLMRWLRRRLRAN